jgi:hypothetical protein
MATPTSTPATSKALALLSWLVCVLITVCIAGPLILVGFFYCIHEPEMDLYRSAFRIGCQNMTTDKDYCAASARSYVFQHYGWSIGPLKDEQ